MNTLHARVPPMAGAPVSAGLRETRAANDLDMIRGLAAVAVLLYHVRYRFFLDFGEVQDSGPIATGWYLLTAFGHDAVMVFFVVSGLLVGAGTVLSCRAGRWSWPDYLSARCVRLYVVLVPGLLLTAFWDQLGLGLFETHPIYTGAAQPYAHDFFNVPERAGGATFLTNLLFLQGIIGPPFGSNEALWSLTFEFWYYIAFPFIAVAVIGPGSPQRRIMAAGAAALVFYVCGPTIAAYFPIWLLGVAVGILPSSSVISRVPRVWSWVLGGFFALWLLASHTSAVRSILGDSLWLIDSATGLFFAIWLYALLHDRRKAAGGVYALVSQRLAGMSYTLYVVHLPLLVFLRAWLAPNEPWAPTARLIGLGCAIAGLAMIYASAVASLTERRTGAVRRAVDTWRRAAPPRPAPSRPI